MTDGEREALGFQEDNLATDSYGTVFGQHGPRPEGVTTLRGLRSDGTRHATIARVAGGGLQGWRTVEEERKVGAEEGEERIFRISRT